MFDNGNHILNFYNREYFLSFILHCDVEDYNFSNHIVHKDLWSPLHLHHRICCRHISHLFDMYNNATATVSNEMFEQKQCVWNFDCRSSTQCEENCRGCNRCNCGCALAFEFIIVETYEVAGVEGMSAWYLAGSLTSWRVVAGLLVGQSQYVHAYAAVTTIVIVLHRLKLMQWKGLLHAKCSKK